MTPRPASLALVVPAMPDPDAILTCQQVADWLQISPRQVQRLGIPYFDLGPKNRRYRARDVMAYLETKRRTGSAA
jgi:hypothetical protein